MKSVFSKPPGGDDTKKKIRKVKETSLITRIIAAFAAMITIPIVATMVVSQFSNRQNIKSIESLQLAIIVLAITAAIMLIWVYWSINQPVTDLKKAAQNIRDGNLEFDVEANYSVHEMNELALSFEEMRKRLWQSQHEMIESDRESKELLRNISHDLKTPITSVKGYVEGIMDGVADTPEKMERYVRTIYNKTLEMDRLINELTYYSKINTNRLPYEFTKLNINDYFADCVEELKLELKSEGIQFTYKNMLTQNELVIADPEQLARVIHNIVNNSIKYMNKPEKKIEIRLLDAGDYIQAEIEDNGCGIPKKDQSKVFDRCYRTDASRNSGSGGSGIGLSIVRKIMEDHGGKVWAGGEEGVGTVISFVLRKYQEVDYSE